MCKVNTICFMVLLGSVISQSDLDMWEAAKDGNLDGVKKALATGANPNWRNTNNERGWTALHVASAFNHPAVVSALLDVDAKKDLQDTNQGSTALHWAAANNNPAVVRVLLDAGANKNMCGYAGITPLYIASEQGSTDSVKELINHDADVNLRNCYGWFGEVTPLMAASYKGHLDIVKALIGANAKVRLSLSNGYTALHGAAQMDHREIALLLLQHGAYVSILDNGMTPSDIAREREFHKLANIIDNYAESNNFYFPVTSVNDLCLLAVMSGIFIIIAVHFGIL